MAKNISEIEFTVFDLETTGLEPGSGDRVIEIAAVRLKAGQILREFQSLVNPGRKSISPAAFAVNQISHQMLREAPQISEVMPLFLDFISDSCLASYNAQFDFDFLSSELRLVKKQLPGGLQIVDILTMAKTISKEIPLAEITLRKYEKPSKLSERELVRKLCLSIGLLQPGDSRDVVVDVLYTLLKAKKELNSEEVRDRVINFRKQKQLPVLGVASSNVRRQLKRLRDVHLVEKVTNNYRITENLSLNEIMEEKLEKFFMPAILERVKDYFRAVDEEFSK